MLDKANHIFLNKYEVINSIAIQNYMSSGSMFFQSLLDNHSNILSTPALYSREIYKIWEGVNNYDRKSLIDHLINNVPWFDKKKIDYDNALHLLGENKNENACINEDIFRDNLEILLNDIEINRKNFFEACHLAYSLTLGRKLNNKLYFLFPIHTLPKNIAKLYLEDYPDAKFLYMIRDPIKLFDSILTRHIKLNLYIDNPIPETQIRHLLLNKLRIDGDIKVYGDRPYFPEIDSQFRAIRLEDLHSQPKDTLKKFCKWLNISFEPTLLESTFNGKKWWNKVSSKKISGFDNNIKTKKFNYINSLDLFRLELCTSVRRSYWRYTKNYNHFNKKLINYIFFIFILLIPFKSECQKFISDLQAIRFISKFRIFFTKKLQNLIDKIKKKEETKNSFIIRNRVSDSILNDIGIKRKVHAIIFYNMRGETKREYKNKNNFEQNSFTLIDEEKSINNDKSFLINILILISKLILHLFYFILFRKTLLHEMINAKKINLVKLL